MGYISLPVKGTLTNNMSVNNICMRKQFEYSQSGQTASVDIANYENASNNWDLALKFEVFMML